YVRPQEWHSYSPPSRATAVSVRHSGQRARRVDTANDPSGRVSASMTRENRVARGRRAAKLCSRPASRKARLDGSFRHGSWDQLVQHIREPGEVLELRSAREVAGLGEAVDPHRLEAQFLGRGDVV